MNNINNELAALKTRGGGVSSVISSPSSPISVPPPPSGPPGGPLSPLGGPPGSPPPPPGGPPGGAQRPANPQSLRGAIMGELKQLFAKRQSQQ